MWVQDLQKNRAGGKFGGEKKNGERGRSWRLTTTLRGH